jgi:hypothetical protein
MLAFPGALFFSFPYSESLYLVVLLGFFWALESERWRWTAVLCFLLPLARPIGIFILLPLTWSLWVKRRPLFIQNTLNHLERKLGWDWEKPMARLPAATASQSIPADAAASKSKRRSAGPPWRLPKQFVPWLLALCPLLGYATYFGLMHIWTGNASEGFDAQRNYPNSPSLANILDIKGFLHAFADFKTLDGMMDSALDRFFFLLFLALLIPIYRLNRTWFFYALLAGLVPAMTSWFMSYRRYVIVLFPVFAVMALKLEKARNPRAFWYWVFVMAALQAWAIKQFVTFNWAG